MSDAVPMPGDPLTADDIDLHKGYTWTHGNYSKKNEGERQAASRAGGWLLGGLIGQTACRGSVPDSIFCFAYIRMVIWHISVSPWPIPRCTLRYCLTDRLPACLHSGMTATRQFVPPNNLRVVYDKGIVKGFNTMGVPVQPGVSRVFGRFVFGAPGGKTPLLFKLMAKLPHWARVGQSPLADQDTIMNAKQVSMYYCTAVIRLV